MTNISNNQIIQFKNEQAQYSTIGNNNTFKLTNSRITLNIVGNNNIIQVKNSQLRIAITGNNNVLKSLDSQINYSVTGNNNNVSQNNCNFVVSSSVGNGNIHPSNGQQRQANRPPNRPMMRQQQRQNQQVNYNSNMGGYGNMNQIINLMSNLANFQAFSGRGVYINQQINRHQGQQEQKEQVSQDQEQNSGLSEQEIAMLPKTKSNGRGGSCSVCLDEVKKGHSQIFLFCFHRFHDDCIYEWLKKSKQCPVCQLDIRKHLK